MVAKTKSEKNQAVVGAMAGKHGELGKKEPCGRNEKFYQWQTVENLKRKKKKRKKIKKLTGE